MNNVPIAVVDDHPLMLEALVSLLSHSAFGVVATGTTASDITRIAQQFRPEVMVVDLSMVGDAFEAIAAVVKTVPETKIVAFTAATGVQPAIRALEAGASGYVLKGSSSKDLIHAIECVRRGESYITQAFASQVIAALRNTSLRRKAAEAVQLSIREDQIVRFLLRGRTNKEIALALKISEKTVKHYMTILMQKLNVRNRLEVVIAAQRFDQSRSDEMRSSEAA